MASDRPVTEFLLFPTTPNFSQETGWIDTRRALGVVPGVLRQYWGTQIDDALQAVLVVNWDSMSSRVAFPLTPAYPAFAAQCMSYVTVPVTDLRFEHALLQPHPPTSSLTAPVVEIARVTLRNAEDKQVFEESVLAKLVEALPVIEGCAGSTAGPTVENPNVFFIVNGWESLEAHAQAVSSDNTSLSSLFAQLTSHAEDISSHFYSLQYPPGDGKTIA